VPFLRFWPRSLPYARVLRWIAVILLTVPFSCLVDLAFFSVIFAIFGYWPGIEVSALAVLATGAFVVFAVDGVFPKPPEHDAQSLPVTCLEITKAEDLSKLSQGEFLENAFRHR
jgi:hypothetical protein